MESITNSGSLTSALEEGTVTQSESPSKERSVEEIALLNLSPSELDAQTEALKHTLQLSEACSKAVLDTCVNATGDKLSFKTEFQIFFSTFLTIFLAEIGDKTQLTVLLISAESNAPWIVFLGAGTALVATSLCGVLLGRWLSTRLSPKTLETSAGALLLGISLLLSWDLILN